MSNNEVIKEEKKIPTKNYVIVIVIFAITIGLILYLKNWYLGYQDYQKTIPILSGVVSEVRYNEVYNYIDDNQSVVIYIGVANNEDCREIETDLKKLINKKHLKEKIVYFNISEVSDKDLLLKELNDRYAIDVKVSTYPAVIVIEDGKIIGVRSKNANKNLSIDDVKTLFEEHNIYGD